MCCENAADFNKVTRRPNRRSIREDAAQKKRKNAALSATFILKRNQSAGSGLSLFALYIIKKLLMAFQALKV